MAHFVMQVKPNILNSKAMDLNKALWWIDQTKGLQYTGRSVSKRYRNFYFANFTQSMELPHHQFDLEI